MESRIYRSWRNRRFFRRNMKVKRRGICVLKEVIKRKI